MHKSSDWQWAWLPSGMLCALSLVHCGARTSFVDDPETAASDNAGAGGAAAGNAGAGGDCEPFTPCAGTGNNIDPTTGLRTACGTDAVVNRRGMPVRICHHIK